ncbi:hypothetical protein [Jannaschia marina]|uniref:hypothetical protein n=1 Tax=Jannaschia marina TaxID=2741674 RepID=UPI0038B3203B
MSYSDRTLMVLAWCCLRQDWRHFHAAGIEAAGLNGRSFRPRRVGLLREYMSMRRMSGTG